MIKTTLKIGVLLLSISAAQASLDPGSATVPMPNTPTFLFLLPNGSMGSSQTTFSIPLPYTVAAGDLVLLQNATGGTGRNNWSEVIRFSNVTSGTPHGIATVYSLNDWTSFVLDPSGTDNIRFVSRTHQNTLTSYSPDGAINYKVGETTPTAVPEASTWLAGALLALPFGLSALRVYRRKAITA